GRRFVQDALARHEPICRKVFNKKRKPFNSLKQRLQGTEIPTVKKKPQKNLPERKSNWRQQHENFIAAIRSAKLATIAMKEGRPLPPPPPPTINPDYIQCPYCMRRFNEAAAERHINFCKEQAARRAFAPGQKGTKTASGKQGSPKKEPTLTSAVGTLALEKSCRIDSTFCCRCCVTIKPQKGPLSAIFNRGTIALYTIRKSFKYTEVQSLVPRLSVCYSTSMFYRSLENYEGL
uniref:Zinc finger C2HC-type containing 1B n=1 Tax=Salvator merianae TaxID=96440 RepID=A0A8D0EE68_SALMN